MIRIRQIKLSLDEDENLLKEKIARKIKIDKNDIKKCKINKKSIDARKDNINFVYEVDVEIKDEKIILQIKNKDIIKTPNEKYKFEITGTKQINKRPIIVGSGPAGLFAAYLLSKYGYNPIIIERGEKVEKRVTF